MLQINASQTDSTIGLWLAFANNSSSLPTYRQFTWPVYEVGEQPVAVFAMDDIPVQLSSGFVNVTCG